MTSFCEIRLRVLAVIAFYMENIVQFVFNEYSIRMLQTIYPL